MLGSPHRRIDGWLDRHQRLHTKRLDFAENLVVADAHLRVLLAQLLKTPLRGDVLLLLVILTEWLVRIQGLADIFLIVVSLFLYTEVGQVDEPFLELTLCSGVGLGRQAHQTLWEEVSFEWLEPCNDDVNSHVILETAQKMRPLDILLDQVAGPTFGDFLHASNDLDAAAAGTAGRLHDVHVFIVTKFSLLAPALPVLR